MPHINALRESKYLKKEDLPKPVLATIKDVVQENIALEGNPPDNKWIMYFAEPIKPLILNSTNAQIISASTKLELTEQWPGQKIVLYNDPNVSYQGKLIGGVRVRAPRVSAPQPQQIPPSTPAPTPPPATTYEEPDDPEVPF